MKDGERTKDRCHEPSTCLGIAKKDESSSDSDSSGGFFARVVYSNENVLIPVIKVRHSTTCQEDVTKK